jgi:hypothetical protein
VWRGHLPETQQRQAEEQRAHHRDDEKLPPDHADAGAMAEL